MNPNNQYYPPGGVMPPPMPQQQPGQPLPSSNMGGKSSMKWIVITVLLTLLLIGAVVFAFWAFGERQDYKNNSDQKSAIAVAAAKKATTEESNKKFAEELKNPLKTYVGPASYGSVTVKYPKTYSAYVTSDGSTSLVDAYFHPDIVPSTTAVSGSSIRAAMALHVQVLSQPYDQIVVQRQSSVAAGTLKATPYALPKMEKQVGTKFVGKLVNQLNGTEIVLPLRDKTLVITSETDAFLPDFNTYVLPNITFEP